LKKAFVPLGVLGVLLMKFKALLLPALKFFPVLLKTGGSMFLTIWVYAQTLGWWYAARLRAADSRPRMRASDRSPTHRVEGRRAVFIPFMGAFIALKEAPPNAWIEAQVGIGGPLLGTAGAVLCEGLYQGTGTPLFRRAGVQRLFFSSIQPGANRVFGWRPDRDGAVALVVACGPGDRQRNSFLRTSTSCCC